MGGLFSSPPADNTSAAASSFAQVYATSGFVKVFDVFVGENGLVQILVQYPDGTMQSWGTTLARPNWVAGPKFGLNDNDKLTQLASGIKLRQQGGIDSHSSDALEKAIAKGGVPMDLRTGYKFTCALVAKARILTGNAKESYEQC
jgi:hypothetical protein